MFTTPPPRSPSSPSESASLTSFLSTLSASNSVPRSSKSLFSPTQTVESAVTNGTGCTGSTEIEGTATKSLIGSVEGREEQEGGSWIKLEEEEPEEDRLEEFVVTEREYQEELKGFEGDEQRRFKFPQGEVEEEEKEEQEKVEIKEEEGLEDERNMSFIIRREEDEEEDARERLRVTASQEQEGLERSVTRSQSDFTRWLEDTMRLARGDGSSVIETDDALSSIIQATRETRFGHSSSSMENEEDQELLRTPIQLEDSLPIGDLSFEHFEQEDEVKEEQTPMPEERSELEGNEKASGQEEEETKLASPSQRWRNYGWKLFSLSLSLALAYSLHRQRSLALSMQPTRSTRFVPTYPDNSTTIYSPFATPLPVAPSFTLPIYAILFTLLAAVPSSIHLLRRRSAPEAEEEEEEERTRAVSPLLDLNGDDLLKARQLLELGTNRFDSRQYLLSISALEEILPLACPVGDKALASECLGKSHFQLARLFSNDPKHLGESKKAFERSIRLDKTRATPRLGLGVTKYWMGDYEGAMKALETSIKRDETRSEAYEYLAKSLYRKEGSLSSSIQSHLDRALQLDPTSYSTLSFYGEILHLSGGRHNTLLAKKHLERSVELRIDQPQVHARLAFIANESLDPLLASSHFRSVLKHRQTGRKDDSCPCSLDAIQGITPFLSLYFVLSPSNHTSERISMLQTALLSYPHDELLSLLISIHTSSSELETRSNQLKNRSIRYPEDTFVKCLYALSLLAMGEMVEAEKIYQEFWKGVGGVGAPEEDKRRTAWLVMGFYEIKGAQQQKKTIECVETTPVKVKEKRIRVKVEEREESSRETTPVRRSTRIVKRA